MKETVLAVLKEQAGAYVSGEELSNRLQVSRTAVWKHIGGLRDEGYEIESSPRLGYRLVGVPDLLLPLEIQDGLETEILGRHIEHRRTVSSTNRLARDLAAEGAPEGTVVLAETQESGRGRLGRSWISPVGGIWLSLVLRPNLPPYKAQLITLLAAVAAVEATERVAGVTAGIKWPNDLLLNYRKLAGILTEVSAEMERVNYMVLGIGVNANIEVSCFEDDVAATATSLLAETGQPICRAAWVRQFLKDFEAAYLEAQARGFSGMLDRWRKYSVTLGQDVDIQMSDRSAHGKAMDIDEQGALLVRTEAGLETFLAGDVSLKSQRKG